MSIYTEEVAKHGSFVMIHRLHPRTKRSQFLAVDYRSQYGNPDGEYGPIQVKFPGGTNKGHPGEHPDETAVRELEEETGFIVPQRGDFWNDMESPHCKHFYFVERKECRGRLKEGVHQDDDGDEIRAYWLDVTVALKKMFGPHCRA